MPSSIPAAVAAHTLAAVGTAASSSLVKTNITAAGGSSSGPVQEPVTPTRAAVAAAVGTRLSPLTPVKQAVAPAAFAR